MSAYTPTVRAADVGYGHIKFTEGRNEQGEIVTNSMPSQSPVAGPLYADGAGAALVMNRRDTFRVPVDGSVYEVGREVRFALDPRHESEVLDTDFALSPSYAARLLGAVNYMLPGIHDHVIDLLVLGLPMNTYEKHQADLAQRFKGTHVINERGTTVEVRNCHVFPQPLGSYAAFIAEQWEGTDTPTALTIDPGYNTVDWFVCRGMAAHSLRSKAIERGVNSVLRAVATDVIKKLNFDAAESEVVRAIDASLTNGVPFKMYGQEFDLAKHMKAGDAVISEAAQAIKNSVGTGSDIDVIVMSGGGAALYASAVADKFPRLKVVTLDQPALANVRGFQILGERLAGSLVRATRQQRNGVVA